MQIKKKCLNEYQNPLRRNKRFSKCDFKYSEYGQKAYVKPNFKELRSPKMQAQRIIDQKHQIDNQKIVNPVFSQTLLKNNNTPKFQRSIKKYPSCNNEGIINRTHKKDNNKGLPGVDFEYTKPSYVLRRTLKNNFLNHEYNDRNQDEDDEYQDYQNETDFYSENKTPKLKQIFTNKNNCPLSNLGTRISSLNNDEKLDTSSENNIEVGNYNRIYMSSKPNQKFEKINKSIKRFNLQNFLRNKICHKYNIPSYNNKYAKKEANSFCNIFEKNMNNKKSLLEKAQANDIGNNDGDFNNRYRKFSKTNRISHIFLAQNKDKSSADERGYTYNTNTNTYNRNDSYDGKKLFKSHEKNNSRRAFSRDGNNLFINNSSSSNDGTSIKNTINIFFNVLCRHFCLKIQNVFSKQIRPYVWGKLIGMYEEQKKKIREKSRKLKKSISRDCINNLNSLTPKCQKWPYNTLTMNMKNNKIGNLVKIRALKENRLREIRNAFNKWVFVKKIFDAEDRLNKCKSNNSKNIFEKKKKSEFEIMNKKIKELEEELKLFREYFSFCPHEKLISINFISTDQHIDEVIIAKDTDLFSKIEADLYKKYEKYKYTENYFLVNGVKINKNLSLKENHIQNKDILTLCKYDDEIFKSNK